MGRKPQTLQVVQDATVERMAAAAISKVGPLVPPWLLLGAEAGGGALSHAMWGGPGAVAWAAIGCTLGSTALTGLTWLVSHRRRMIGRVHSTATAAAATGWFTLATVTGTSADFTAGTLFFGGATLALSWNIRSVIRATSDGDGLEGGDALSSLFDRAKEQAGLKGARARATEVTERRVKGVIQLPPGEKTSDDAQKASARLESGMQLPPGSVTVTQDEDRADRAHMSVSDPRAIRKPVYWPGPSRPGASIDKPLRIGLYQDGTDVEYRLVGQHLQIMGMTNSGKSIGGAWNVVGEIVTRVDPAVFSIDISKDEQTMGPLRQGLHRFETTKAGAVALIRAMYEEIPKRTAWLAEHGYRDWEEGCGLLYWVLHLEEVAKLFAKLDGKDSEKLEEILKELRSAGGSVIYSLQRATYDQLPTIVRSQATKMCFGLADADDTKFGVSTRQRRAEVAPHEWENHYPGMAVLDGKGIPTSHFAMPLRTFSWGDNSRAANAAMVDHCASFPAADKPADEFTARLMRLPTHTAAAAPGAEKPAQAPPPPVPAPPADDPHSGGYDEHTEYVDAFNQLLADAAEVVVVSQHASTAMLQRKMRLAHEDCLRVMEALERKGIVGPASADGSRPVLVPADDNAAQTVERLLGDGDAVAEALHTPDPDPGITAGAGDAVQMPTPEEADALEVPDDDRPKLSPAAARALLVDWVKRRHADGNTPFAATDPELTELRRRTGTERPWLYKVLGELTALGVLEETRHGRKKQWHVESLAPLDDPRSGFADVA